jgi:glucose/arabinose dehydrogenase
LAVYRGDLFEGWDGDLLVGAMAGAALHRVIMDGNAPAGEERYLLDRGERVRDVRAGPDGAIYVATELSRQGDQADGKILRLTPQ